MPNTKRENLHKQLEEIEMQLKKLQEQFIDIKKRTKESITSSRKRVDEREVAELRKQLGLDN